MVDLLKREYWSKADAFLLPLTGLKKDEKYGMKSHLFWNEYSIYNYNLVVSFSLENKDELLSWCRKYVFPILDRKGYLVENYDTGDRTVFVLDIAEWAYDVQLFLKGKYSKFSKEARKEIHRYHNLGGGNIYIHIYAVLYPNEPMLKEVDILDGLSPIEYVSKYYGFDLDELKKIGEIGTLYDSMPESLLTDSSFCETIKI